MWAVFIFTAVAVSSLRLLQIFAFTDELGFYTDGGVLSYVILGTLLASAAAIIALTYSNKDLPKRYTQERSIPLAITELFAGAMAIAYSLNDVFSMGSRGITGGFLYVMIILSFFGVGAGLVFMLCAVSCFIKRNLLRMITLAGILPPIWMLIVLFMNNIQMTGDSAVSLNAEEGFYGVLTRVAMTFFIFYVMKFIAGAQGRKTCKRVYAFGCITVCFGLVSVMPNIVSWITRGNVPGPFDTLMAIFVLALSLFAVVFMITVPRGENAYEEEFVEEAVEQEETETTEQPKQDGAAVTTAQKKPKKEKKKREGNAFERFHQGFLEIMAGLGDGVERLFRRKNKKKVRFEAGQLDEKPTMKIDDSWRLDMYGLIDDEQGSYKPQIHTLSEEQQAKQQRVREEVAEMIRKDSEEEEQNAPIPEWKRRRTAQKEKYERRYKKKK